MIKVGLIGYGFMGGMHSQCHQASGESKIVALADVEQKKRDDAKAKLGCEVYDTVDAMLASADIDMVDICTPTYLHEEHAVAAARAGKHVLCEKPMALTVESCDRMIEAAKKAGVQFMVAHVIRFWPEYQVIKQIVDSGKLGKVKWLSARRLSPAATWSWQDWIRNPAKSGGAVLDLHIHDQDYVAYLIGSPKKVQARGALGAGGALDDVLSLGWEHNSGASSYVEASLTLPAKYPFTMSLLVVCEKGTIKLDSGCSPSLMVYPADGEPYAPELPKVDVDASAESGGNISDLGGYFLEIKYFLECLKSGKTPDMVTPESAREAVRICLAVAKSAETGQAITL